MTSAQEWAEAERRGERLFEVLVTEAKALSLADKIALAKTFREGLRWRELPENIRMRFRSAAERLR